MDGLYYYKLVSPYKEDVTKNCKLTVNEIDHNFFTLKESDIKKAEFVRSEDKTKSEGNLILTLNKIDEFSGENVAWVIPIDLTAEEPRNLTYDLKVSATEIEKNGTTITISYKDNDGEKSLTVENVITKDNLIDVIGSDVLTKVITDGSLKGLGTMRAPLRISATEKTGMLASAIKWLDLTSGGTLPVSTKAGERYVTSEYLNDYGYLYNGDGVSKISSILDEEYEVQQIDKEVSDRKYYWHVPSKEEWDALLDSIEPCWYKNHKSAKCHVELGKFAGKFLKSDCGWINSEYECTCDGKKPYDGCKIYDDDAEYDDIFDLDELNEVPDDKRINPVGIDKYGMSIRPAGVAGYKKSTHSVFYDGYKYTAAFWTTTPVAENQDIYIKIFNDDMSGVFQVAECPTPYYSVRLVKKYDGNNYRETEYINGVLYKCILMPESGQIWLATNFADKKGFVTLSDNIGVPEVLDPNGGISIPDMRKEMFINEYNGRYWEKKIMEEGTTIVIQNPCFDDASGTTVDYVWYDSEGVEQHIIIEIPKVAQSNLEYRVYTTEDECDKVLKNTDDLVVERVLSIVVPIIDRERWEREKADAILSGMIETETAERISADEFLSGAIDTLREDLDAEISARTEADEFLSGAIDTLREDLENEIERATEREDEIEEELFEEIERAQAVEAEISGLTIDTSIDYVIEVSATDGDYNMILKSKDGIDDHFVKIKFDGDFGSI